MSTRTIDLNSLRAKKARLANSVGKSGLWILLIIGLLSVSGTTISFLAHIDRLAYATLMVLLIDIMLALWYKREVIDLPNSKSASLTDQLSGSVLARLKSKQELSRQILWDNLSSHWQIIFLTNHLFISTKTFSDALFSDSSDLGAVWQKAEELAKETKCPNIEPAHVGAALIMSSSSVAPILTYQKLQPSDIEDVTLWLGRIMTRMRSSKAYFGGIGRDWANGFTPILNRFGLNISLSIERNGGYPEWLTRSPVVLSMKNALVQNANAVALIGDDGAGKTSDVRALAHLLLEDHKGNSNEQRQIIELNPAGIISIAQRSGELESIVMSLLGEAVHARNIILFLDNAQLFFNSGIGAFDITQILLPVIQAHSIQIVLAMNHHDYQQLRSTHNAFANLLTPIVITEPGEGDVMRSLEDNAVGLETEHNVLITYDALRESYRLSGRYEQDLAYPGKAIRFLTQSLPYAKDGVVSAESVQSMVEQSRGVKVTSASSIEADTLLNLEDRIHEHMINQSHAVSVVAGALRRARAGVADPKRPSGSFLFLGPTGVGKTELGKAIAATYFGSESQIIQLDMTEYQQPEDIKRLLSDGQQETRNLLLQVREQPFSVVILDEIEKAHPNILNLLLQLLDEGRLTDSSGRVVSFKECIVIATSNAGAQTIRDRVEKGESPQEFKSELLDELIKSGQFKPELLNRFDEIVVFRPLNKDELAQVVQLMMQTINHTLGNKNISVELTKAAVEKIVATGYDPRLGARPMRHLLQTTVEDVIAQKILREEVHSGDHIILDANDLN